jgi:serine/threonine-protein kinase
MRKKRTFKAGQVFGKWKLVSYLGGGGNGEVWRLVDDQGAEAAIKLLRSIKEKPYRRFKDETAVIEKNADVAGIIPIFDKNLPEKLEPGKIPFYVMPIAKPAMALLKDKTIEAKVEAMLQVASTLDELHKRGISHRDIKPGNLLYYNSRLCLADFGLVDYPNKEDVSVKGEEIGTKWTIAPEMRRDSANANGLMADVYSLAKMLWIILTGNEKGFDGQYSATSTLSFKSLYSDIYASPIDTLLSTSTEHDPKERPKIAEFISKLKEWQNLNEDFHEMNQTQWTEIQRKLFPTAYPKQAIWENIEDFVFILKIVCSYESLNHVFFPTSGGNDLIDARLAGEEGCIELDFQSIEIVKPKRLIFESFDSDPDWNYFRLELAPLEPTDFEDDDEPEDEFYDPEKTNEDLTEVSPGSYDRYEVWSNQFDYDEEYGRPLPESARLVTRWFKGTFVIFGKRSVYNMTTSTYDSRHNKMNAEQFRDYIQENVDYYDGVTHSKPEKFLDGARGAGRPKTKRFVMKDL